MLVQPVEKFFADKIDSAKIDNDEKIPEVFRRECADVDDSVQDVLQGLKDLGLFGLQIPAENEGLGLSNTGYARIVEVGAARLLQINVARPSRRTHRLR